MITRTWSDPGMPYYAPSGLFLDGSGHSIEPGVVFKVGTGGFATIELDSAIQGVSGRPIVFTSFLDDSVAGDTNRDGPSVGAPGDWVGLETIGGGEWSYLDVRYGTIGLRILSGPTGSVRNSVFRFNGTGLRLESGDPIPWTVADSQFVSNDIGASVLQPNFANLGILSDIDSTNDGRNQFACNVLNLENAGAAVQTVVAEGNWWGAAPPEPSLFLG